MADTFYRATLRLERVEPCTDGNTRERGNEISACNFTGDTPEDAMYQLSNHAETLYDWYQSKADEASTLDEGVPLTLHDLSDRLQAMFAQRDEQTARAEAQKAIDDVIAAMAKQPAETTDEAPLADWERGLLAAQTLQDQAVDPLPASADDEGDETAQALTENRCSFCGDVIAIIGEAWSHAYPNANHEATPANLAEPKDAPIAPGAPIIPARLLAHPAHRPITPKGHIVKRTFTRDELEELDIPDDPEFEVYRCQTDSGRWHSSHELVFRTEVDGPMWLVRYQKPLTEMQDCDLWFGWPTVGAVQVEPYEATVTKYRPVTE